MKSETAFGQLSLFGDEDESIFHFDMRPVDPMPLAEKLQLEKEYLGFYISGHPLDKYAEQIEACVRADLSNPSTIVLKKPQALIAQVTAIRQIITKDKKKMGFFTLQTKEGDVDAVAFPKLYEQIMDTVEEDGIYGFMGAFDQKDKEAKLSFLIDKVVRPEELQPDAVQMIHISFKDFIPDQVQAVARRLKESEGYMELRNVTADQQRRTINAQTDVGIKNLNATQAINAENMAETLRIQREEAQRAQRLQTETNFIGAHALDQQTEVLKTGAASLGTMSNIGGGGGGMNPAGIMTGMMMGGALGGQMAGMMNQMGGAMQGQMNTPPPIPTVAYMVAVNGVQSGPFNMQQLQQLVQQGQMNATTYVWKQGMANWELAGNVQELKSLFVANTPPPVPNV